MHCLQAEITLLVSKEDAPDLYNMEGDEYVETGPFKGSGLDLKGSPMMAIYLYPTVRLLACALLSADPLQSLPL